MMHRCILKFGLLNLSTSIRSCHLRIPNFRYYSNVPVALDIDQIKAQLQTESPQVVVMAGAGISTASGLPDFRSPGTGLYHNLQKYNLPDREAAFDLRYFMYNPEPFFKLARELYPSGRLKPNIAHYFVRMLQNKKLLLRMYTQNIDGFERLAGIDEELLVEAHGTFATATCMKCGHAYRGTDIQESILKGNVAYCKKDDCDGLVKPDIVFLGEQLPERFHTLYPDDMQRADLLLVMGTSLEVYPFANLADAVRPETPRVLFNMHPAPEFYSPRDVSILGDLSQTIAGFAEQLGWTEELNELARIS